MVTNLSIQDEKQEPCIMTKDHCRDDMTEDIIYGLAGSIIDNLILVLMVDFIY